MKKIFTLFLSISLFSIAAFSQENRYRDDGKYNNPYTYRSTDNRRNGYQSNWNDEHPEFYHHDRRIYKRGWHNDVGEVYFNDRRVVDNCEPVRLKPKMDLSFQIVPGRRH